MSRRSARLVSGGYYQSDEDSDSSSVTNISYRESPVRVFKKKAGSRKSDTRTLSRANSNASSVDTEPIVTDQTNPEPDQYKGLKSALDTGPTEQNMRTLPYSPTSGPTPRPALIPARGRSRTPTLRPDAAAPPESGSPAGASSGPGGAAGSLHAGSLHASYSRLLNQNSVDNSSGYSSAEGPRRRIPANTPPAAASGRRAPAAPGHTSSSSYYYNGGLNAKKALSGLLLLLLLLTCVYYLVPLLALVVSRLTVAKTTTPTPAATQPVSRAVPPAVPVHRPTAPPPLLPPPQPAPQLCPAPPTPAAVDPALLSAAVAEEMDHVLEKLLLKQENLHSQAEQALQRTLQQELQALRARLEAVDLAGRLRLEAEAGELSRLLAENQAAAGSASSALAHRVLALETHNKKLREELSSIQTRPEPAPCPAPDQAPVQNQLTPELQQAMENWLADRMKEHYISGLGSENSCTDCGRPMADKMADFALESQGASVVSTRCSETYSIRSACVTLFGFPLWYPSESPRTVIQGYPVLLPGKCWAFRGVQGTLVLSLSHPVAITHVTLDHLPRYNAPTGRIDSAPRDFEVYGMESATEEGPLLGTFTYDQDGESTQTFQLPQSSDELHRFVELRILSNWGQMEYTCVYRFRVHGKMAST